MNKTYLMSVIAFILFSSFRVSKTNLECEYAGSNISFAKSQTEKAININDINKARFFAYKALNAIEKSKKQLSICGCAHAEENVEESLKNLKLAIKATSLSSTKILLTRALEYASGGLESLEEYHIHKSKYASDVLVLNTMDTKTNRINSGAKTLNEKIDISLNKYRASLNKIVETVNCEEARAFAENIFNHCESELLKDNLSDGKKYYNLRTKEITAEALEKIGNCPSNKI